MYEYEGVDGADTRLRRSTAAHDAYTVRVADRRVVTLATARPRDVRRWVHTTRWLLRSFTRSGRRPVVGLGVQWTAGVKHRESTPPPPATLQLCVGHRCLVFHLAQANAVPRVLYRFLADADVLFVGFASAYDCRILREHRGLQVASRAELRSITGMGQASLERMAERFLGYRGVVESAKPKWVAMSAWHASRLSAEQVGYACVDAYISFRLGAMLCSSDDQRSLYDASPLTDSTGSDTEDDGDSDIDLRVTRRWTYEPDDD